MAAARPVVIVLLVAAMAAVPALVAIPALLPAAGPVLSHDPAAPPVGQSPGGAGERESLLRLPRMYTEEDMIAEAQVSLDAAIPADRVFIHNKSGVLNTLPPGFPPMMDF
ncbi:MAG TPA: hypothetical protein VGR28_08540, partial [Candidatus Thermoplasmatota archaeon]|nr:hypothetical protein [Candidatus Thermoplasmatota archaeon]